MNSRAFRQSAARANGFSLVELIIITGIISVVLAAAIIVMPGLVKGARADSAAAQALNTLRLARDRAIGDRRNMQVVFTEPKRIEVVRQGIFGEANATVAEVSLEGNQKFMHFAAMLDTDDGFGLANKPVAFGPTAGTIPTLMFTSEGTLIDGSGDAINGTLFLADPADTTSARAVSIFGATALLRTWRWDGKKWTQ